MISFDPRGVVPDDAVCIAYIDTTYPSFGDDCDEYSLRLKERIERDIGCDVIEVDIYPGASGPGWLVQLPISDLAMIGGALSLFFLGAPIKKNIDAWVELAARVREKLTRPACLSRAAAASLVIDEILTLTGQDRAREIVLNSYKTADSRYGEWRDAQVAETATSVEPMSVTIHVFEIVVDGATFLAVVDKTDVGIMPVEPLPS